MPPKKKKGSPVIDGVDTSTMSREQLEKFAQSLTAEMEREREERNFFQLERDKLRTFWEITRKQLDEAQAELRAKDREVELAHEQAEIHIKHNTQQMKHLQYEHVSRIGEMHAETMTQLKVAQEDHGKQELELYMDKRELRRQLRETQEMAEMQIQQLKMQHCETMSDERNSFMKQIREMQALHEQKLQQFAKESDVRYRMDLFELDERRSAHIDQLTKTHEEAVEKIQSYFHGVTMNQLALIGTLKEQSEELRQKLDKSEKTAASLTQENKRLTRPLQAAQAELGELTKRLEHYDRDRAALRRTALRSKSSHKQIDNFRWESEALRMQCDQLVADRDQLRTRFEEAIVEIQQNAGVKNALLERKMVLLQKEVSKRDTVLGDVMCVAGLEPTQLGHKMERLVRVKNDKIQMLRKEVQQLAGTIEAYEVKMVESGIPPDIVRSFRKDKQLNV